eukprot:CAMPEP_0205909782 /NCGR_PEP_ID=MMETSP1325-20131115/4080_1 /ASSEMBLY_ACC=CAM_ASM_000708 /TAXON_ID=236786 /ORGANISM="Florenciella sp., Strain RCC1007" /LENGTH=287 /DNA_ID=CAMNT_0053276103 /DNA_START=103 /DNA_END=966 /DNA_ORIENTATION=+
MLVGLTICALLACTSNAALPPLSNEHRMSAATHIFTGTLVRIKQVTLLDFRDRSIELWKGADVVDPSRLDAFELSKGQVDRSSGHVWETEAEIEVNEYIKGPGHEGTLTTVRYRDIALPLGMVGPTGQHSAPPELNGVYRFFVNEAGRLLEPNGFEREELRPEGSAKETTKQVPPVPPIPLPVALDDDDELREVRAASFSPPKLKHSRRGGFVGGEKLVVTRPVTTDECPWLDANLAKGEHVFVYRGHTYGVVGPGGLAVSRAPPEEDGDPEPFFELPRDAVALHAE